MKLPLAFYAEGKNGFIVISTRKDPCLLRPCWHSSHQKLLDTDLVDSSLYFEQSFVAPTFIPRVDT